MILTVAEFIKRLEVMPQNYQVRIYNEHSNPCDVDEIIPYDRDAEIHIYLEEK